MVRGADGWKAAMRLGRPFRTLSTTLHSPNDRYPNDARIAQAVAQMWTRIGVQTQVEASPFASFATRSARQEFAIRLGAWGSSTGEGAYFLTNVVGTFSRELRRGASNVGRYSNPDLDALTARATATIDDAAREVLLRQAVKMVADDVPTILLMNLTNSWASRRGLRYDARMDERTIAMGVSAQ